MSEFLYMLKRPVVIKSRKVEYPDHGEVFSAHLNAESAPFFIDLTADDVSRLFQPFDVSGLTRQVEELLDGDYRSYSDYLDWCDMPPKEKRIKLHSTAEQIVLLLLNQEKETK